LNKRKLASSKILFSVTSY